MNQTVLQGLTQSYTAYHVVEWASRYLEENGFTRLYESEEWSLAQGGKYYVVRGGSALIAFRAGADCSTFTVAASHTDSPALKLKYNPVQTVAGLQKLNVETYGGGIWSTFTDVPLAIAGRVITRKNGVLSAKTYTDPYTYVIPNVAIHLNRKANDGYVYNAQVDLAPLFGANAPQDYFQSIGGDGEEVVGYDLFAVNATKPFLAGSNDEFLCAPGIDNRISAISSLVSLVQSNPTSLAVAFLADNEEVGSRSAEGADSDFLKRTLKRATKALNVSQEFSQCVAKSFLVSVDNAHGIHPNHPELSDPTNKVELGKGIVIKHHANRNYTTTGLTAALFDSLMQKANVPTQNFFMRSDLRCGSTLGAISSSHIPFPSVDVGVPQLAMHSSLETVAVVDCDSLLDGLTALYEAKIQATKDGYSL